MTRTIIITFADFCVAVDRYISESAPRHWRVGQSAFNVLRVCRPDLADLVSGGDHRQSEFDPFYEDANLPAFYGFLARHWDE